MKLRSSAILGFFCFGSILAMDYKIDCKDIAASGLMDAIWYSAAVSTAQDLIDQNNTDNQGQQGAPGAPGAGGVNCWDLDGDGLNDADEDTNGDGEWNALDCQGSSGEDGLTTQGAPGAPGADGLDGTNCWDLNANGVFDVETEDFNDNGEADIDDCRGADGSDFSAVIARGLIPGAEIPDDADWIPAAGTALNIQRVYRPETLPGAPPSMGRYRVVVKLPDRGSDYLQPEIVVLVSASVPRVDGSPPGTGGATAQLFVFWEVVVIDNTAGTVEFEVQCRTAPLNFFTDATFSMVVMAP